MGRANEVPTKSCRGWTAHYRVRLITRRSAQHARISAHASAHMVCRLQSQHDFSGGRVMCFLDVLHGRWWLVFYGGRTVEWHELVHRCQPECDDERLVLRRRMHLADVLHGRWLQFPKPRAEPDERARRAVEWHDVDGGPRAHRAGQQLLGGHLLCLGDTLHSSGSERWRHACLDVERC